jgi:cysteine rich repeat protein
MTRFVLLVPLIVLASMAQVSAQQQQGHDACARDVTRHCRAVMNDGDQAILACLKQNRARISKGCDKVLVDHGQ